MKQESEYIKVEDFGYLLGLRARFKNNLTGYCSHLWLKEGIIIQHKDVEHIGLSIKFDKQKANPKPGELNSCYIKPGSIELFDPIKKKRFEVEE